MHPHHIEVSLAENQSEVCVRDPKQVAGLKSSLVIVLFTIFIVKSTSTVRAHITKQNTTTLTDRQTAERSLYWCQLVFCFDANSPL